MDACIYTDTILYILKRHGGRLTRPEMVAITGFAYDIVYDTVEHLHETNLCDIIYGNLTEVVLRKRSNG